LRLFTFNVIFFLKKKYENIHNEIDMLKDHIKNNAISKEYLKQINEQQNI